MNQAPRPQGRSGRLFFVLACGLVLALSAGAAERPRVQVDDYQIDAEIQPGKTTAVEATPQAARAYTIICDHFCGVNHGAMHMTIEVVE